MVVEPRTARETHLFTVDDYDLLPDDGPRYEVIDGVLLEMAGVTATHQRAILRLLLLLDQFVTDTDAGEVFMLRLDVELSDRDIVQPDLMFVSGNRSGIVTERRIVGAPDLVVEVSLGSTRDLDLGEKWELYRRKGVQEYWFIDVEARTATVWTLIDDRYVERPANGDGHYGSGVLPGFTVDLARIFADADRQR